MKVLYFYQFFATAKGSWGKRVYEFARRWVKEGDSVIVITSAFDKSGLKPEGFVSRIDVEGIDVRVINIPVSNKQTFTYRIFSYMAYAILGSWYALTLPADVVISSSGPISVGIPGLVARYLRRKPFIFEVRDIWPEGAVELGVIHNRAVIGMARFFERWCYRASSLVIALSEGMEEWIRKKNPSLPLRIEVITNASDNSIADKIRDDLKLPGWAAGKNIVIYVGTIGRANNCSQILDAAAVLKRQGHKNIEIAIIGDGRERLSLEARATGLGLDNVHFPGLMPQESVVKWMFKAKCMLLVLKNVPVLDTSSPNKLFDAFAVGLPVIQVTQGWIKDMMKRENCGITVPPDDPEAMAGAITEVIGNTELRNTLKENSRRAAREIFDQGMLADKMRSAIMSVARPAENERSGL
ncbi:MAG: glycosyltransferase family 4 protein [Candidatus Omnitrophica bacterium]|nr:glycosyltransferase family 4 protein [Candidatus Omnitrophota bacterium]